MCPSRASDITRQDERATKRHEKALLTATIKSNCGKNGHPRLNTHGKEEYFNSFQSINVQVDPRTVNASQILFRAETKILFYLLLSFSTSSFRYFKRGCRKNKQYHSVDPGQHWRWNLFIDSASANFCNFPVLFRLESESINFTEIYRVSIKSCTH